MKKVLGLLLLLSITTTLFAQRDLFPDYSFRLGLTAHPNFGFMKAENGKGNGTSLGFTYGLLGDFNFAENYSFSTGLTITTINGKTTEINAMPYHAVVSSTAPIAYNLKYKMQYVEIPLTIKLKTANIDNMRWYGQFGLSNDFRIGSTQNAEVEGREVANDVNSSKYTNFYRAGVIIGGGAEFDLDGKTSVMTGLTLNNGFTNVSSYGEKVRNHFVALNIGVFF